MLVAALSRSTSRSLGKRSFASARNTAVQLGSSPTTGVPAEVYGASAVAVRCRIFLAMPSWPVEIQVRPQHSSCSGMRTVNPAASSTSTAATPIAGERWLLKVSGQSRTSPREPSPRGRSPRWSRRLNQVVKRIRPKSGIGPVLVDPAGGLDQRVDPGRVRSRLTTPGAIAASRAQTGSQPIE